MQWSVYLNYEIYEIDIRGSKVMELAFFSSEHLRFKTLSLFFVQFPRSCKKEYEKLKFQFWRKSKSMSKNFFSKTFQMKEKTFFFNFELTSNLPIKTFHKRQF